jgi:single-strand DNA-binding protein
MNIVAMVGNLTADPEIKYSPSGLAVATVRIAQNRYYKQGEEWQEETSYFTLTAFGKTAEGIVNKYSRGDKIVFNGRLKQERWEKDGQKHSRVVIIVEQVTPVVKKGDGDQGQPQQARPAPQPPKQQQQPIPEMGADDEIPF